MGREMEMEMGDCGLGDGFEIGIRIQIVAASQCQPLGRRAIKPDELNEILI